MTETDENGWMPIETAPADFTTEVDLWARGARYTDCFWGRPTYGDKRYDWIRHSYDDCNGPVFETVTGATHWRALPKPPVLP